MPTYEIDRYRLDIHSIPNPSSPSLMDIFCDFKTVTSELGALKVIQFRFVEPGRVGRPKLAAADARGGQKILVDVEDQRYLGRVCKLSQLADSCSSLTTFVRKFALYIGLNHQECEFAYTP